jgi:hypothetical protein
LIAFWLHVTYPGLRWHVSVGSLSVEDRLMSKETATIRIIEHHTQLEGINMSLGHDYNGSHDKR